MIISSSVIPKYVHYCQPNYKNVIKIQSYVWLQMLHIYQNYTFVVTVMASSLLKKLKNLSQNSQNRRSGEHKMAYMKHIKIQSCHMGVISTPNHITWQMQQCVHTHSQIMRYHTGNLYCSVVPNVQSIIFLTRKHIISIPNPVLQFVFIFIIRLHVVKNIEFIWQ